MSFESLKLNLEREKQITGQLRSLFIQTPVNAEENNKRKSRSLGVNVEVGKPDELRVADLYDGDGDRLGVYASGHGSGGSGFATGVFV